ncbi:hypothetical protein TURU_041771 [Turdus rufiventris]|nr:hypothetical protein TURU_041771 [Turdus rufiventris]
MPAEVQYLDVPGELKGSAVRWKSTITGSEIKVGNGYGIYSAGKVAEITVIDMICGDKYSICFFVDIYDCPRIDNMDKQNHKNATMFNAAFVITLQDVNARNGQDELVALSNLDSYTERNMKISKFGQLVLFMNVSENLSSNLLKDLKHFNMSSLISDVLN